MPLRNIYFYLTEGCNLTCRHCWIAPKYLRNGQTQSSLPLDLFRSITAQAKPLGLFGIKLTGGEPLLHPNIEEILLQIQKDNLGLTIETNGTLCTPRLAEDIAKCKNISISVSLDGTDSQTHEWVRGVPDCFDHAIAGVKNLVKAGLKPTLIMTLMRRNKNQIEDMIRLAESLGAGSVKFNVIQPTARGESMHRDGETLTVQEVVSIGQWVENVLSRSTRLKIFYDRPLAFRSLGKMFGRTGSGCSFCHVQGILGVLSNGSYALCGIGESVPDLVFGNAAVDRLEDVWNNSKVLQELRQGLPDRLEGICSECVMKNLCMGNCLAQNYYRSKSLWAPFWFCDEAQRIGIFPESRRIGKRAMKVDNRSR